MHSITHSLNPVGKLPVFQIVGGLESERKEFLSRLTAVLKSSRLWAKQVVVSEAPGWFRLVSAARQSDLVLVDCPVELSVRKISLSSVHCDGDALFFEGGGDDRQLEGFAGKLRERLDQLIAATPIWACILIGGQSSRMGQPKHLIVAKGRSCSRSLQGNNPSPGHSGSEGASCGDTCGNPLGSRDKLAVLCLRYAGGQQPVSGMAAWA